MKHPTRVSLAWTRYLGSPLAAPCCLLLTLLAMTPAPGELRSFTASDGAVLCYSVLPPAAGAAAPSAGPSTVLLLHGWSGSRRYWDTVAPLLAARGLRVLVPDLRWHGDSAAGSPAGPAHVARLGADVAELLAHAATERVLLVGSSMGASVAFAYLELFGQSRCAGVVAVDQAPLQNRAPGWTCGSKGCYDAATLAALQAALAEDMGAFADGNAACCLATPLAGEALNALLRAETLRCDPARLGALMADHTARDWRPLLPLLRVPVLSIYGGASGVFPPEGCAACGRLAPRGRCVEWPANGHWLYLERPGDFAAEVACFAATDCAAA